MALHINQGGTHGVGLCPQGLAWGRVEQVHLDTLKEQSFEKLLFGPPASGFLHLQPHQTRYGTWKLTGIVA